MSCGSAIGYVKSYIISSFCLSIINISLKAKGKFRCFFLITQFSLLITHHFKIPYPFGTITHLPSLNIFNTVCGPHICHSMQPFFFPNTQTHWTKKKEKKNEPSERRKKRKKERKKEPNQWRTVKEEEKRKEKERKNPANGDSEEERKKNGQKLQLTLTAGPSMCV